ncbi:MAG: hypothetical protein J6O49_21710 [Bacteroidaceae bacterium]|jgi:hypothetical protein|nr:hypothetical protein [Bacteroidaceae bacterium]
MKRNRIRRKTEDRKNSYASGENKSLEQYLEDIDKRFNERIENTRKAYERISRRTTLEGEELRDYCREWMLWEVRFDDNGELVPMEDVIKSIETSRERYREKTKYRYVKRSVNKDNQKNVYNTGGHDGYFSARVPSMNRSNATWKRFYELFPYYREHYNELNNKNGLKLKKVW